MIAIKVKLAFINFDVYLFMRKLYKLAQWHILLIGLVYPKCKWNQERLFKYPPQSDETVNLSLFIECLVSDKWFGIILLMMPKS